MVEGLWINIVMSADRLATQNPESMNDFQGDFAAIPS